ncbi:hypothetical protein CANARDRAFT_136847 [[Candida] arabinofermentans NRRL YB-2248]|uniref:Glutamine amidotransferase domain-containing protein n=1 Tax=[Candida] arabinofermentans NRRL YB-2248 TaxID=983967 RepID=A0A1E4T4B1_9ASCO|nr:hypothetical protein CANARDRAFT_136847 [[Candida] arabinofermentans NRRL YB-2248]
MSLKVAILLCDTQIPVLESDYGNFADQAVKLLTTNDHKYSFDVYNAMDLQLPNINELKQYHAIYITGSRSDSYDTSQEWITNTISFLKNVIYHHDYLKIVGVCFGHQLIALAIGMNTGKNNKGWEVGLTEIKVNESIDLFKDKSLNIVEMHQDIAYGDLPIGFTNIGSSSICQYQGFYKFGKLLSFQGHPEFSIDCAELLVKDRVNRGIFDESILNDVKFRGCNLRNDSINLQNIIFKFLNQ